MEDVPLLSYPNVQIAQFENRENRFVSTCLLSETKEVVKVHVKNTGRCKELLKPGVDVALSYQASSKRKTDYDLIAVKKNSNWINIDSQIPNTLAESGILSKKIKLPHLAGEIIQLKREVTFQHSRFDLYVETDQGERAFIEVKGMTLENHRIGAFPDAPTSRGLKHVHELHAAIKEGYKAYLLFIVQFENIEMATIHEKMQPELQAAIKRYQATDLNVVVYNCQVTPETIGIKERIPFNLEHVFEDPNA